MPPKQNKGQKAKASNSKPQGVFTEKVTFKASKPQRMLDNALGTAATYVPRMLKAASYVPFGMANEPVAKVAKALRMVSNVSSAMVSRKPGAAQDIGNGLRGDRLEIIMPAPFAIAVGSTNPAKCIYNFGGVAGSYSNSFNLNPATLGGRFAIETSFSKRYAIRSVRIEFQRTTGFNLSATSGTFAVALSTDPSTEMYQTLNFDTIRQQQTSQVFPVASSMGSNPFISMVYKGPETKFTYGTWVESKANESDERMTTQFSFVAATANAGTSAATDANPLLIAYCTMRFMVDVYDTSSVVNFTLLRVIADQEEKRQKYSSTVALPPAALNPVTMFCKYGDTYIPVSIGADGKLNIDIPNVTVTPAPGTTFTVAPTVDAKFNIQPTVDAKFNTNVTNNVPVTVTAPIGLAAGASVSLPTSTRINVNISDSTGANIVASGGDLSSRIRDSSGNSISSSGGALATSGSSSTIGIRDMVTGATIPLSGRNDGYGNGVLAVTKMTYAPNTVAYTSTGRSGPLALMYEAASTGPAAVGAAPSVSNDGGPSRLYYSSNIGSATFHNASASSWSRQGLQDGNVLDELAITTPVVGFTRDPFAAKAKEEKEYVQVDVVDGKLTEKIVEVTESRRKANDFVADLTIGGKTIEVRVGTLAPEIVEAVEKLYDSLDRQNLRLGDVFPIEKVVAGELLKRMQSTKMIKSIMYRPASLWGDMTVNLLREGKVVEPPLPLPTGLEDKAIAFFGSLYPTLNVGESIDILNKCYPTYGTESDKLRVVRTAK